MNVFRTVLSGVATLWLAAAAHADVYYVTSTADAGPGSLRQAIEDANAHGGPDEIRFALGADKKIAPRDDRVERDRRDRGRGQAAPALATVQAPWSPCGSHCWRSRSD